MRRAAKPPKQVQERTWPQVDWRFRLTASLAVAIVLACAFNSLLWVNRPFPGFFVWENMLVPAVGGPDWTGYEAGVPYESRLVAVGGNPVTSAEEVYKAARRPPIGTRLTYTFESGDPAGAVTLLIPTMRLTVSEYLWTLGTYLLIGSMLTVLGFAVYLIRPDAPAARAMLVASTVWGLYLVTSADMLGPGWFRPLHLLLKALAPVALVDLALKFPVERRLLARRRRLLPALYVVGAGVGVAENLAFDRWFGAFVALDSLHGAMVIVGGVVLIGTLVHSLFFLPSAAARQRTKIAAVGAALAFLSPVVGSVVSSVMGISIPFNFLAIPLALFPLSIGWAIVKHNLFEVDAIIRRAVSWAVLTGVIAVVYLGGVGFLEVLFTGRGGRIAQLFFLIALVAVLNPLWNQVQAAVDFLFARDRYDYRKTLAEASQALATLLDLETVVERILATITQTIHVDFGAVWLRDDGAGFRLHAVAGERDAAALPQEIPATRALIKRLARRPQHILGEEALLGPDGRAADEIVRLGARLLVPMAFERRLVGLIALGQKESGRFYSGEDLELLRTLANQGAVAVENARTYHALMRANEELQAAQSRLIEAERLAAIGELSASVAHGIRNPLAGIKAAAQYADLDLPADHPLHETIVDIISEVDKLEGRIKALLDFARPFAPRPAPCQIGQVINDSLASLRSQIAAQGIALSTRVASDLPSAQLDYAQIEQVLLALLSNAVEAMPHGGQLDVSARLGDHDGHVRVEVADTGPGIPPDQIPNLFTLFHTGKPSGTGLGLAFAKKIVELHGGRITVESAPGRGSRFIVELPLVAVAGRGATAPAPAARRA